MDWRPGPVGLAAIAATALVIFGLGAVVLPPLLSGGSTGQATSGTPAEAAPAPVTGTSSDPAAAPDLTTPTATGSPGATATAAATPALIGNPAFEDQVLTLVNAERKKAKCDPVHMDERLRGAARGHSVDMVANNFVDQRGSDGSSPADRMRKAGYPLGLSESVARGPKKPQDVVKDWMHSRGDRDTLVNCGAKAIGVGLAYRGRTPLWTLDSGSV
jgi:uncharacterized protein YkwD